MTHIGGAKGRKGKALWLFSFSGAKSDPASFPLSPVPLPFLAFNFGASCQWLWGIVGSQFCLNRGGMRCMSCPGPAEEVDRRWDPGSILEISSRTSAPAPASLWELWKSLWTCVPSVSCLQSAGLGRTWFPRSTPILLELQQEGTVLTSLEDLSRSRKVWWLLLFLEMWFQTPVKFCVRQLCVLRNTESFIEKKLSCLSEWVILFSFHGSWLLHSCATLALIWLTSYVPVALLWCLPELWSRSLPCLGLSSSLKCLPGGHLSSHRELCPSLLSSGKETLKKPLA